MITIKLPTSAPFDKPASLRRAHPFFALEQDIAGFCRKSWQLFERANPLSNRLSAWVSGLALLAVLSGLYLLGAPLVNYLCLAAASLCLIFAAIMDTDEVKTASVGTE